MPRACSRPSSITCQKSDSGVAWEGLNSAATAPLNHLTCGATCGRLAIVMLPLAGILTGVPAMHGMAGCSGSGSGSGFGVGLGESYRVEIRARARLERQGHTLNLIRALCSGLTRRGLTRLL